MGCPCIFHVNFFCVKNHFHGSYFLYLKLELKICEKSINSKVEVEIPSVIWDQFNLCVKVFFPKLIQNFRTQSKYITTLHMLVQESTSIAVLGISMATVLNKGDNSLTFTRGCRALCRERANITIQCFHFIFLFNFSYTS